MKSKKYPLLNDKRLMKKLYVEHHLSSPRIAKLIGCDAYTVLRRVKFYGFGRTYKDSVLRSELHPNWKGDNVKYVALHNYIRRRLIKPKFCQHCFKRKPLDLSNKSHQYSRNLCDWEYLCRSCHFKKEFQDGVRLDFRNGKRKVIPRLRRIYSGGYFKCQKARLQSRLR